MKKLIPLFICLFLLASCNQDPIYLPKPRMYPKIDFPTHEYSLFDQAYCDLQFEYPNYASIEQDLRFFNEKPVHPCWFNIDLKPFNGTIHCSYIPVEDRTHFDKLVNDAFNMVEEHNIKASYRQEERIENQYGVGGLYFTIGGEVASTLQFILSDTTSHFLRGSLYFNAKVNSDSIAPIYNFVKEDIDHMLNTFQWGEE